MSLTSKQPSTAAGDRPRTRGILSIVAAIVIVLCLVFAVTTVRQRAKFRAYQEETLRAVPPWEQRAFSVEACVEEGVRWAMNCPGVESWCFNEAPQRTRVCLESADRSQYCASVGDVASTTSLGYAECDRMRETQEGKYGKRMHKKHCAASYRAVAEHCQRIREPR